MPHLLNNIHSQNTKVGFEGKIHHRCSQNLPNHITNTVQKREQLTEVKGFWEQDEPSEMQNFY